MRTIKKVILYVFLLVSSASGLIAQNGTLSSGGVASGSGGSATYSVGQVNYITATGAGYRITEGLQQPFSCSANTPAVSITASPSGPICAGSSVTFTATTNNTGGGSVIYNFKVNGTSVQNGASNSYTTTTLTNGDAVSCTITITGGTCLTTNMASSNTITMLVNNQPVATCSNDNPVLYYGHAGDQTATIKAIPSSGVAPYTVSITMNRPLNCNIITSSGDEIWSGIGGTTINNICPATGSGLTPVSTGTVLASGGYYSVNVTLMQDAVFTATITDATGCIVTCTTTIHAEDARCFTGNSGISKVTVCHQTGNPNNPCVNTCLDESAVALHLDHGDFLGNCTPNCVAPTYNSRASVTLIEAATIPTDLLKLYAFPNPASTSFNLKMESVNPQQKADLKITNAQGQLIETRSIYSEQIIKIGQNYRPGLYFVELLQGNERKTMKLVKLPN